jgi:hypothetical protein
MTSVAASAATTENAASSPRSPGGRPPPAGRRKNAASTVSSAIPAAAPSQSHAPSPLKLSAMTAARAVPRSAARSTSRRTWGRSAPPEAPEVFLRAFTGRRHERLREEGARTEDRSPGDSPSAPRSAGRRPWPPPPSTGGRAVTAYWAAAAAAGSSAGLAANPSTSTSQRSRTRTGSRSAIAAIVARPPAAGPSGRGGPACHGGRPRGPLRDAATGGHHRGRARRRRRPPLGDPLSGGRAARTVRNSPGPVARRHPFPGVPVAVEHRVPSSTEVPGMQIATVAPGRAGVAGERRGVGGAPP